VPSFDLTDLLKAKKLDERGMVRAGERFFTSLGPSTPARDVLGALALHEAGGPDVVCHASAWDVDNDETCASRCASR
jgi:peptidyl-dipeptidase A